MKVVFLGSDRWGHYYLKRLIKQERITAIVTMIGNTGLLEEGEKNKIPVYTIQHKKDQNYKNFIREIQPDLIISAGFSLILKNDVLNLPSLGAINIHGSYLPAYRGAQPLEWQIINGESFAGVTIHYMDEGIDTGDILAQKKVEILQSDTVQTMMLKLSRKGGKLLNGVLSKMEKSGRIKGIKQQESEASYYRKLDEQDRRVDWSRGTKQINDLIRGLPPYTPAYSEIAQYLLICHLAAPIDKALPGKTGQIIVRDIDLATPLIVGTGDGNIALLKYQVINRDNKIVSDEEIKEILSGGFLS